MNLKVIGGGVGPLGPRALGGEVLRGLGGTGLGLGRSRWGGGGAARFEQCIGERFRSCDTPLRVTRNAFVERYRPIALACPRGSAQQFRDDQGAKGWF